MKLVFVCYIVNKQHLFCLVTVERVVFWLLNRKLVNQIS